MTFTPQRRGARLIQFLAGAPEKIQNTTPSPRVGATTQAQGAGYSNTGLVEVVPGKMAAPENVVFAENSNVHDFARLDTAAIILDKGQVRIRAQGPNASCVDGGYGSDRGLCRCDYDPDFNSVGSGTVIVETLNEKGEWTVVNSAKARPGGSASCGVRIDRQKQTGQTLCNGVPGKRFSI